MDWSPDFVDMSNITVYMLNAACRFVSSSMLTCHYCHVELLPYSTRFDNPLHVDLVPSTFGYLKIYSCGFVAMFMRIWQHFYLGLSLSLFFVTIFGNFLLMAQNKHTTVSEAPWIVGLLQWRIVLKSPNFNLKSERLQVFFVWSKIAKGSFGLPVLDSESFLNGP